MGRIAWYKRDPRAALTGMMELNLEERGAYTTVLDLIYDRCGELPDDDRFIAGWCRCDLRVWKRIKARLIELGKLYVEDGCLRNARADRGILEALSRVTSAAEAGRASGAKRGAKPSENNALAPTPVGTAVSTNKEVRSKKEESAVPGASPRPAKAAVWDEMRAQIGRANPGALVGKWCRDFGEENVLAAHFVAMKEPRADYVSWMSKHLDSGRLAKAKANAAPVEQRKANGLDAAREAERRRAAEEQARSEGLHPMTTEGMARVAQILREAA